MSGQVTFFKYAIEVQALFSLFITLMVYTVPLVNSSDLTYIYELRGSPTYRESIGFGNEFQDSIEQQRSFGVVELGALALYSGNILIDLILNFFTAIPSMATIIVNGVLTFLNVTTPIKSAMLLFTYSIVGIIYLILIITLLLDIRTKGGGGM